MDGKAFLYTAIRASTAETCSRPAVCSSASPPGASSRKILPTHRATGGLVMGGLVMGGWVMGGVWRSGDYFCRPTYSTRVHAVDIEECRDVTLRLVQHGAAAERRAYGLCQAHRGFVLINAPGEQTISLNVKISGFTFRSATIGSRHGFKSRPSSSTSRAHQPTTSVLYT